LTEFECFTHGTDVFSKEFLQKAHLGMPLWNPILWLFLALFWCVIHDFILLFSLDLFIFCYSCF
jgi:hypothetical protein